MRILKRGNPSPRVTHCADRRCRARVETGCETVNGFQDSNRGAGGERCGRARNGNGNGKCRLVKDSDSGAQGRRGSIPFPMPRGFPALSQSAWRAGRRLMRRLLNVPRGVLQLNSRTLRQRETGVRQWCYSLTVGLRQLETFKKLQFSYSFFSGAVSARLLSCNTIVSPCLTLSQCPTVKL